MELANDNVDINGGGAFILQNGNEKPPFMSHIYIGDCVPI